MTIFLLWLLAFVSWIKTINEIDKRETMERYVEKKEYGFRVSLRMERNLNTYYQNRIALLVKEILDDRNKKKLAGSSVAASNLHQMRWTVGEGAGHAKFTRVEVRGMQDIRPARKSKKSKTK